MQKFLFVLFSFCLFGISFAQNTWKIDDYQNWNHANFRQNKIFNQTFSTTNTDYLLLDAAIFYITNEERAKVGIEPMQYHKLLEVAAYNHSMKMATTGFFSHQNSIDASRYSTSDRGKLAGVTNPSFAENIAYNYPKNGNSYLQVAEALMDQWMNSPGHKSNILSSKGRQMGGGTYYYNGKIYGTQVFQWFSDVIENPYGASDQLPIIKASTPQQNSSNTSTSTNSSNGSKCGGSTSNSTTTTNTYNTQSELSELKSKVSLLNSEVAEKEGTIAKLNREVATLSSEKYQLDAAKTNLTNSVNSLQQQYAQKDAQYNKLKEEFNELSDRRTSVRKSKYNADEFHALTFKIGLNTFYPSINPISLGKFNMNVLSFGAETMLGVNFGDSYRRNSLGITLRANQANRFLTKALDSSATQPIQFYDAELTTLIREWLSIGIGASFISSFGSPIYQITPSASLGLCLGPKNWKIQLTQQASVNSDKKIIGRASLGLALRL
jgi:uncharacterized protein YkwD